MNLNSFDYQANIQQNAQQFRFGKPNFTNNEFASLNSFSQGLNPNSAANASDIGFNNSNTNNNNNTNMNLLNINNNNNGIIPINKKRKAEPFTCTICSIEVGSQDVLQSHINGQKHAKRLRQIASTKAIQADGVSSESVVATGTKLNNAKPALSQQADPSATVVTKTEQKATSATKQAPQIKLHLQELNDLASFHHLKIKYEVVSESGPQHAKQFEIKCVVFDPKTNADSETYTTTSTSINKAKQAVAEIALQNTKLQKPSTEQVQKKKTVKQPRNPKTKTRKPATDQDASEETTTTTPKKDKNQNMAKRQSTFLQDLETQRYNKRFLLAKHIQIQPDKEQMSIISQLISSIEQALLHVSDKLMQDELKLMGLPTEGNTFEILERARKLKGIFRVGPLEKGLLLKTDRELNLVALTSDIPTFTFVKQILSELNSGELFKNTNGVVRMEQEETTDSVQTPHELNKAALRMVCDESLIKSEACAYFVYEYKQPEADFYRVKLSFTSTKLDHDLSQINVLNCSKDSLPLEKCLDSIDEIRRTKWFSVKLKPIANAMLILRVMRDFCRRTPTWFILSDWLLELVVDKCFVKNKYEKVSLKFRTVFESISAGMFFLETLTTGIPVGINAPAAASTTEDAAKPKEPVTATPQPTTSLELVDPCKKHSTKSVFEHLTLQQKEDLTASAQHAMRLIAFKKINQMLALDAAEANLLFSSTTSSDRVIHTKRNAKKPDNTAGNNSATAANGNESSDANAVAVKTEAVAAAAPSTELTANSFDYEKSENFNENINNISMFILNNYASNMFDMCFNFLDLSTLKS
jgi:hypothetical protein